MAKTSKIVKGEARAEVQDAEAQPLPALRAPAGLLPQVRALPHLPAWGSPQGLHPGHDQVELV